MKEYKDITIEEIRRIMTEMFTEEDLIEKVAPNVYMTEGARKQLNEAILENLKKENEKHGKI